MRTANARLRQECLNEHWLMSLEDAREKAESWRRDDDENHPQSLFASETPEELRSKMCEKSDLRIGILRPLKMSCIFKNLLTEWTRSSVQVKGK